MSAKYFCDCCKAELRIFERGRVKKKLDDLEIEVMHSLDNVWNGGHVCHSCIIMVVMYGKTVKS